MLTSNSACLKKYYELLRSFNGHVIEKKLPSNKLNSEL